MSERFSNGTYPAVVVGSALLEPTKNGTDQIAIEFELTDEEYAGKRITAYKYFSEKATKYTMEALRICGWNGDDLAADPLPGIAGTEVSLVLENEEYEGEVNTKVKYINRPGGVGMGSPMSDGQKKAFAARMKGEAIASRQANGSKPSPSPAGSNKPEDKLPF